MARPLELRVLIQAIGRGTTKAVMGFRSSPRAAKLSLLVACSGKKKRQSDRPPARVVEGRDSALGWLTDSNEDIMGSMVIRQDTRYHWRMGRVCARLRCRDIAFNDPLGSRGSPA